MLGTVSTVAMLFVVLTLVWMSLRWRRQDEARRLRRLRDAADVEAETYARLAAMERASVEHLLLGWDDPITLPKGDLQIRGVEVTTRANKEFYPQVRRRTHTTQPNGKPWTREALNSAEFDSDGNVYVSEPEQRRRRVEREQYERQSEAASLAMQQMISDHLSAGYTRGAHDELIAPVERRDDAPMFDGGESGGAGGGASWDSSPSSSDSGSSFDSGGGSSGSND